MFYATPIAYAITQVPPKFQFIAKLNPMAYLIDGYRDIFYNKTTPDLKGLLVALGMGVVLFAIGYWTFRKLEKRFAEEL
jgi:ABC-type polysaccharide/polyol phosphate export permease